VVEIKNSRKMSTLLGGFDEAFVYRWEFREQLSGWPKAILVGLPPMSSEPQPGDDIVAVGWDAWVPDVVLDGLIDGPCSLSPAQLAPTLA
jgi:hypothetical protein